MFDPSPRNNPRLLFAAPYDPIIVRGRGEGGEVERELQGAEGNAFEDDVNHERAHHRGRRHGAWPGGPA